MAPPTPSSSNPYGSLLLGAFIGLILYGLAVNQSTSYFYRFPTDKRYLKAFVAIILFVETLHSTLIVHWCYTTLISKYGHPEALALTTWSMNLFLVSTGLVVTITQFFYSYRVLLIGTKYRILVAVAILLTLVTLGCATAGTVLAFGAHTVAETAARVKWVDSCGIITALITDVLNAGVLIRNLHKCRTGVKQTDHLLDRLILYCLNTGLLIGITMTVMCIIGFFQKEAIILFGLGIVATKLYSNSVLATLNSRRSPLDFDGAQSLPEVFLMSSDSLATDRDRDRARPRGHRAGAVIDIARPPGAAAGTVTHLSASTLWKQDGSPDDSEDANGPRDAAMEGKVTARIV